MRPLHGDDPRSGRPRQRAARLFDNQDAHLTSASQPQSHMSFFIADEASLDSHRGRSAVPPHLPDPKKVLGPSRTSDRDHRRDDEPSCSSSSRTSLFSQSPVSVPSQAQPSVLSRPITPMMLDPSCVGSISSSTSSRRNSLTSLMSDPLVNYDRESAAGEPASAPTMLDSGSAPQLLMPSIMMPSRRPFTETGKHLGRLKIVLAGETGVGKTSLLKAIVQTCDHIVHVDPIPPVAGSSNDPGADMARPRIRPPFTTAISEVYASTKPYPEWWQELDAPGVSHKRKRLGDNVLERNICFVETPGYGRRGTSVMEAIMSCVDYVEYHLRKMSSDDLNDSDIINILGGSGGCQVDAVLYLVSHTLNPADVEFIHRLVPLTNVIPILTRAELLSEEQIAACKQKIAGQLADAGIQPFTFTPTATQEKRESSMPSIPYTASSATVSNHDVMDASLLMSPDYVQPLIPTDLAFLVENMFSSDGASWLRHSAAKKYLQWQDLMANRPRHLYRPLAPPVSATDYPLASHQQALSRARPPRPQQYNGREQIWVADWATELQQSLAKERLRYDALARGERAVWLTEKLHECVQDGTLVVANGPREVSRMGKQCAPSKTQPHQDPLGLLQVTADLKAKSWMAVEVLGSVGVVGLALWASRHGWPTKALEVVDGWARF
ncbi:Septin-domain-containing protein [Xylaria arbuscula]|nr:Septin-domain-containing protein [Xylaria arbuscula]